MATPDPMNPPPNSGLKGASKTCFTTDDLYNNEKISLDGKDYPLLSGRLRLLREHFPDASLTTDIVPAKQLGLPEGTLVVKATLRVNVPARPTIIGADMPATGENVREATAYGTSNANSPGDKDLADSILEVAESRAVARAARFFGLALDATGAEEVSPGRNPNFRGHSDGGPPTPSLPTERQLAYIESLRDKAEAAGVSVDFKPPKTQAEASAVIDQLLKAIGPLDKQGPTKVAGARRKSAPAPAPAAAPAADAGGK